MTFFKTLFSGVAITAIFFTSGCGAGVATSDIKNKYAGKTLMVIGETENASALEQKALGFCGQRSASIVEDTAEFSGHSVYIVCDSRNENGRNGKLPNNRLIETLNENTPARDIEERAAYLCGDRGYTLSADTGKFSYHRLIVTCGAGLPR
jgi:hypothetical protein